MNHRHVSFDADQESRIAICEQGIFEIHPVILGGSPTDPANKTVLNRAEHIEAIRDWNRVIRDLRSAAVIGASESKD